MKRLWAFIAVALLLFVFGCGGGSPIANRTDTGGSTTPVTTPGDAQGVYFGNYNNAPLSLYAIVLPNDMYYSLDGQIVSDGTVVQIARMSIGQGTAVSGSYKADLTTFVDDDYFSAGLSAKYVPATSMNGAWQIPGGVSQTFSASAPASSVYSYNSAATLSHITGVWTGHVIDTWGIGAIGTITISPTGDFSGNDRGCTFSGKLTPNASKNFFDVNITFGAAPCWSPNQTGSGVAIEMLLPNGSTRQLLIAASASNSALGFAAQR